MVIHGNSQDFGRRFVGICKDSRDFVRTFMRSGFVGICGDS